MSYYFNADEIFEIAEQIEKNGESFYDAASEGATDPKVASLCKELAGWEKVHVEIFAALRRALPEAARQGSAFDPDDEIGAYVKSAADSHVFVKNKDPRALARACRDGRDILEVALTFEKDSVVFYTAMQRIVPKEEGQEKIGGLVEEELKHIRILSDHLAALGAK